MEAEQNLGCRRTRRSAWISAEYFRPVADRAVFGRAPPEQYNLFQRSAGTGSIGAGLLGPIFSGGRIKGDIREAESVQKQMP